MVRRILGIVIGLWVVASIGFAQEEANRQPTTSTGKIVEVTLYRDSATVTREIDVSIQPGNNEVIVDQLPENLIVESVFAEGNETVAVRAVRIISEPVAESTSEEVRSLDAKIQQFQNQRKAIEQRLAVITQNAQSLDLMIMFSSEKSREDLNSGVLKPEAITTLFEFASVNRMELQEQRLAMEMEMEELFGQIEQLSRERNQLANVSPATRYLARLFLDVEGENPSTVRLNYSVSGCDWSPQMSWSTQADAPEISLRYGAVIRQVSGEDWNDVRLTLSTASPSVNASGPVLAPLRVVAVEPDGNQSADDLFAAEPSPNQSSMMQMEMGYGMEMQTQSNASPLSFKVETLRRKQRSVETAASDAKGAPSSSRDLMMNRIAGEIQNIELLASAKSATGLASDAQDEVAAQTYVLEKSVNLQSRREQQLVSIVDASFKGSLTHVATPLLSSFAYRQAEITNDLEIGLLRSPATIYLDERFVGGMEVPTTASGQRLNIGFGADDQVRTRRELVKKVESIQGGNQRFEFTYKLVVSNFKSSDLSVRVLDRIPITDQTQQTSVTLGETSVPLSEDAIYRRVQQPLGLLRFDVTLPAKSVGGDALDIIYSYTVEFDRNRKLKVEEPSTEVEVMMDMQIPGMGGGMGGR